VAQVVQPVLAAAPFILGVLLWIALAVVAAIVAPPYRRPTFCLLTLFILGPLGVAAAAIAQPRQAATIDPPPLVRRVAAGRQRFTCPRCGADNDIPKAGTSYDCWRCSEHRNVQPAATTTKSIATE
jgi:DNA-directed RNA polymerase subunit RPC12/RpoP